MLQQKTPFGNISEIYEVEVPQLKLTSKVNLSAANGKGTIELAWSGYDISNKYFVIYRKQEGEEEWKTIVGLEEKFNESSYIDNLANDKNSPTVPEINIEENSENNKIEITSIVVDSGTKYTYYIESYDNSTGTLISKSSIPINI